MFISKLLKGFMIGACISLLSTGAAFAATTEDSLAIKAIDAVVDDVLLEKHKEVDQSVFVNNVDKIKEMGFEVVYTSPLETYVEVGITPYKEEFANYLYEEFGKDEIKVVEGEKAVLYTTTIAEDAPDAPVSDEENGVVGEDITLEEGELGIVSVDSEDDVIAVEDSSKMAESGIVELAPNAGQEETSYVQKTEETDHGNNNSWLISLISVVGALILIVGVVTIQNKKKITNRK